jgi:asparagine synthase (glutamine-hydrolysing)
MASAISHRGPDDHGAWADTGAGIALAHRRLSIVDLSPLGRQPMASASGRYVLVFNGEVYNYRRLREELPATARGGLRGHSDTEVMLAAIEAWGLFPAVRRFIGMFAFVLWDRDRKALHLVRDRLGIKPLYYGWAGNAFVFGSELKALSALPQYHPRINRDAITLLLRHNCIPAPHCIYRDTYKLSPGCVLTLTSPDPRATTVTPFWSAREVAEQGLAHPYERTATEAVGDLDALLRDAIELRMIADVPLGAFLSGGVDSSTVVALMQAQSDRAVRTFSIGFTEDEYNEAPYAKAVAQHLGTEHTELYVTPEQARDVIPHLPTLFDEPFSDASQIPTYLVSRLAREHVTVALSGDGGDELFGGYNRHVWGPRLWRRLSHIAPDVRRLGARAIRAVSPGRWDQLVAGVGPLLPRSFAPRLPGEKLHKLADALAATTPEAMYLSFASHWDDPAAVVRDASELPTRITDRGQRPTLTDFTDQMLFLDLTTYLPDDILTKVDRASMAVSLEARVPLLDHRVVEFAWRLPRGVKVRDGRSKWILREVLSRYVPPSLIERPKSGFGVPIGAWLRGPLRDWAESLLDERRLREEGFFDPAPIRRRWREHLSGRRNSQYHLWDVLMFQSWLESRAVDQQRAGPIGPAPETAALV